MPAPVYCIVNPALLKYMIDRLQSAPQHNVYRLGTIATSRGPQSVMQHVGDDYRGIWQPKVAALYASMYVPSSSSSGLLLL